MSSSISSDSLPPPRNLSDLPAELKARIVELCAEQDARFREWVKGKPTVQAELERSSSWSGRSLSALFLSSREFSEIAAPYLFVVLKASKISLCFKCTVALRRLALFRELHLDAGRTPLSTELLPYIPFLSHVRKLVVFRQSLDSLWQNGTVAFDIQPSETDIARYSAAAFRSLRNLTEIQTSDIRTPYTSFHSIVPFTQNNQPTLSRLHLTISDTISFHEGLAELLAAANSLTDLELTSNCDYFDGSPLNLRPVQRNLTTIPPVTNLTLCVRFLHSSHISFASSFYSTLRHLTLRAKCDDPDYAEAFHQAKFTSERFPRLTHFTLSGQEPLVSETLSSVTPSHLPVLNHLTLELQAVDIWWGEVGPLASFQSFPALSVVAIRNFDALSEEDDEAVEHACSEHGWRLIRVSDGNEHGGQPPLNPYGDVYHPFGVKAVKLRTTLDYVQRELGKAETGEDAARLERLRTVLAPLELERQASVAWERA
ncbi:hypothetical protein JCM8097_000812 [Rhodosporidiobolus ruineniae]